MLTYSAVSVNFNTQPTAQPSKSSHLVMTWQWLHKHSTRFQVKFNLEVINKLDPQDQNG